MANENNYQPDVDGFEEVTMALMDTVNSYPGLMEGEQFKFSSIEPEEGMSIFASSGSFIMEDHESITGHVWQQCLYPFMVICQASGLNQMRKIQLKEWMDTFARWLTRQPVNIGDETVVLNEWPRLTGGRVIKRITKTTPAYLGSINGDKNESWIMNLQIQYQNEFDR